MILNVPALNLLRWDTIRTTDGEKMKLTDEKFYSKIFHYLALFLFAGLFIVGFVVSGINYLVYDEYPTLENSGVFLVFLGLLAAWFILKALSILYDKFLSKVPPVVWTIIFCILAYAISAYWVISAQAVPQADQLTVYKNARDINNGTIEPMTYDSYLVFFPYQLGFVSFLRILITIFGEENFIAYQLVLALNAPIIVAAGAGIISHITPEKYAGKARFLYGFLMLCCVPLHMYTTFIYGDLPFAAMSLVCIWLMFMCIEKKNPVWFILLFLASGVNYLLKTNALIVIAAMAVYLLIALFVKEKRIRAVISLLVIITGALFADKLNQKVYADMMPAEYDSLPMIATVVMGMHDDYSNAGWCNFYHQNVFSDCDFDAEATKLQCMADFKAIAGYWVHNPLYTVDFFYRKINLQWNTPLYQALVMNSTHIPEKQNALGHAVYEKQQVHLKLQLFMKFYQLSMYGYVALALWLTRKKKFELKHYVPLIAVFGSFLFSLMWESKTRYQMPAFIMLVVAAAAIIPYLQDWAEKFKKEKVQTLFSSEEKNEIKNYNAIDLFKIIMALAVVAIHVMPHVVLGDGPAYFALANLFDTAVPFFFLATGFLLAEKLKTKETVEERTKTIRATLFKTIKLYGLWSLIYLPVYIISCVDSKHALGVSVQNYIKEFFLTGDHYNSYILWYLLSSIYALLLVLLLYRYNIKESTWIWWAVGFLALAVYLNFLPDNDRAWGIALSLKNLAAATVKNGRVFEGLFFVPFGMLMSGRKYKIRQGIIFAVCGFVMALCGIFAGFGVALCALGFFVLAKEIKLKDSIIWGWFRNLSRGTYFIHLYVWMGLYMLIYGKKSFGPLMYIITVAASVAVSAAFFAIKKKLQKQ